jgi:hypothetical protein
VKLFRGERANPSSASEIFRLGIDSRGFGTTLEQPRDQRRLRTGKVGAKAPEHHVGYARIDNKPTGRKTKVIPWRYLK